MIKKLLEHSIRKDLRRANKKHTHSEYLRALLPIPKAVYWTGYHKKKLILLVVVGIVSWTYEWYRSAYKYVLSMKSPQHILHALFTAEEKVPKTIAEQTVVWDFTPESKRMLEKMYFQADRRLIFGVSRNYLFHVFQSLGLLQKPDQIRNFWVAGGFYRKRNQLISGVGLSEFLSLIEQSFRELKKTEPELNEQKYLKDFATLFVQKSSQIVEWQKDFNKKRHNEYLKSLNTDNEVKIDEINSLMHDELDISQKEVDQKLEKIGMKGLSVRDKWLYWRNREILLSLREETLLRRLSFGVGQDTEHRQMKKKLQNIEKDLQLINKKKQQLKQQHIQLYQDELLLQAK